MISAYGIQMVNEASKERIEWEEQRVQGVSLTKTSVKEAGKEEKLSKEIKQQKAGMQGEVAECGVPKGMEIFSKERQ